MRKLKDLAFDLFMIIVIFAFLVWLFGSIRTDQEDFMTKCIDKGYTENYCLRKLRP